jgi:hypothetical protein
MAGRFSLTIESYDSNMSTFGETKDSERQQICHLLRKVIQDVGSGIASKHLIDQSGRVVGEYGFGFGMKNAGA